MGSIDTCVQQGPWFQPLSIYQPRETKRETVFNEVSRGRNPDTGSPSVCVWPETGKVIRDKKD